MERHHLLSWLNWIVRCTEIQCWNICEDRWFDLIGEQIFKSLFFEQALNSCTSKYILLIAFEIPQLLKKVKCLYSSEQRGAVEACWAHNPEVSGSKPVAANAIKFRENLSWMHQKIIIFRFLPKS